jgi:hypothetical protein
VSQFYCKIFLGVEMLTQMSRRLIGLRAAASGVRGLKIGGVVLASVLCNTNLFAADATLVSGFYQKSSDKINSQTKGSTSTLSLGGRFSDDLTTSTSWLGETSIKMRGYTAASGRVSPDNGVGLMVGGGMRTYFAPFTTGVVPYLSGTATLISDKSSKWTESGYRQTTISGLYYGANAGIRAALGGSFFVELDLPIFNSPMFAVTKTETFVQTGADVTSSNEESTETALYIDSVANLMDVNLGIGMKL